MTDIFSGVTSNYEAMVAQFKHQLSHSIAFHANYTWSHALDYGENNTTGASSTALLDPTNIRLDKGNSNQNVSNRLVMAAVISSPWRMHGAWGYLVNDFELAPAFATQTGLPISLAISGSSSTLTVTPGAPVQKIINTASFNGSGASTSNRVPIVDRNAYQLPETYVLDMRLSKRVLFRERYGLEFLAEAFNLPNHPNVSTENSFAYVVNDILQSGSTTRGAGNTLTPYLTTPFKGVTGINNSNFALNVRQLQLAVRLQF
jgi:hypothetical protein